MARSYFTRPRPRNGNSQIPQQNRSGLVPRSPNVPEREAAGTRDRASPRAAAISLNQYLDQWLTTAAKPRLRPKSYIDSRTDPYLHAALLAALSLASRKKANADEGDIRALEDVAERVEAEISRLGKMRTHNEAIRRNSDSVAEEIRKGEDKLALLLNKASDVMKALSIEVRDQESERKSPVVLPEGSLERASACVANTCPEVGQLVS
jgi:hypothetical protein